jgi:hypothetical protein
LPYFPDISEHFPHFSVFSYFVPRETPEPRAATSSFAGAETAEQAAELRDAVLWHNCVVIFVSQKPLTIFASIFFAKA